MSATWRRHRSSAGERGRHRPCTALRTATWLLATAAIGSAQAATTYYVRTDGGTAAQCTGKADARYSGSGTNQACAWKHPYYALPPNETARIAGGDTLIIGSGSYMIGWGAPGAADTSGRCYSAWAYDCFMAPVPSGPSANARTRILGQDAKNPPKLWGNERVSMVLNLHGSSNVEIGNLEITDQSDCVESHSNAGARCERDQAPFGPWASTGLAASNSRNVWLHDLNIHGLAHTGIHAGGLTDWTVERVKINANGWVGWDGDIGPASSNAGQIILREVEIAWNGCGERWKTGEPWACWAQEGGGYGDGLGTAKTGGQWLIEDSFIHHNTSDGLDLLYMDGAPGTSVTVRRVYATSNAGNQLKVQGNTLIENSVVNGYCSYFAGKHFMLNGDQCRALGNTVSVGLQPGQSATIRHNTIVGEGDCLILTGGGTPTTKLDILNNVLVGKPDYLATRSGWPEQTCAYYADGGRPTLHIADNFAWQTKGCPSGNICGENPELTDSTLADFDPRPLPGSPVMHRAGPRASGKHLHEYIQMGRNR
ncbi:hypothetical protein INQ41_08875 [Lysobacter ciconiae]|uniref:Right-handed parallel beta-helix repeat-containing protein n=1 Tax=Novilysobacter ciconiae TaxID=2781022 RepID=A0A7S6ZRL6_9GAMM|nr:hypothetical protein [Lysobacter ciconiae]QOW18799.1 hypothetical protein INQ41_08875 [Lysobacter ciconiae]